MGLSFGEIPFLTIPRSGLIPFIFRFLVKAKQDLEKKSQMNIRMTFLLHEHRYYHNYPTQRKHRK